MSNWVKYDPEDKATWPEEEQVVEVTLEFGTLVKRDGHYRDEWVRQVSLGIFDSQGSFMNWQCQACRTDEYFGEVLAWRPYTEPEPYRGD